MPPDAPLAAAVNPQKNRRGLTRVWHAAGYSLAGLRAGWAEAAFRQEVALALILIPLTFLLPASNLGRALMIAAVLLVLIVELLNSGLEATVDRVSIENHPLAKRAKDIGSAAVFVALLNVLVVWGLVLLG